MIRNDNLLILRNRFPKVLELINRLEPILQQEPIQVIEAKNGLPTMSIEYGEQTMYIHSKYDPVNEAEKFVEQFELLPSQHIFIYGIGLGYHVRALLNRLGDAPFTIYEPNPAIFYHFICTYSLKDYSFKNLKHIYLGSSSTEMTRQLTEFVERVKDPVLYVSHPAYHRIMQDVTERFEKQFKDRITDKRSSLRTNFGYEKLWTINSGNNFRKVLTTPSILREKKSVFQGKPVLLAAAGPSLSDEYEHIRKIKEAGSAYIFAVGSANKALINNGIMPDAVTSYDPNTFNIRVFKEIIEQQIDTIPLIFGSSVGYETVNQYPGPKLHMITSQDSISNYLLDTEQLKRNKEIISDAPSIAVVTLELLFKLGCSHIILAGQNLGFRNNQVYAQGIQYDGVASELTEQAMKNLIQSESVDGETMYSDPTQVRMKLQMEHLLRMNSSMSIRVINTTAGGAKIEGTEYRNLIDVMDNVLINRVVEPNWYASETICTYNLEHIQQQAAQLSGEFTQFEQLESDLIGMLRKLDGYARNQNRDLINRNLPRFDKLVKKVLKNQYMQVIILPLIRVQFEYFQKSFPAIREESDPIEKVRLIIEIFGKLLTECKKTHATIGIHLNRQIHVDVEHVQQITRLKLIEQ